MSDAATCTNKPKRVLLWGLPRSLTTVLEKCISYVDDIQVINEAFAAAMATGPERDTQDIPGLNDFVENASAVAAEDKDQFHCWDDSVCTYQWVKETLEADYPGKNIIFCKDIVSSIYERMDMIPHGFRHTFIIRNPTKSFLSLRKLFLQTFLPPSIPPEKFQLDQFMNMRAQQLKKEQKNPFQMITELVAYLKEHGEAHPVIVDADDLQNHPASILRQYCEAVEIPYSDSLLQWEAGDDIVKKNWYVSKTLQHGNKLGNYYGAAFSSTKFLPATPPPPSTDLPQDVINLSAEAEPFYRQLYEMRLRPWRKWICQLLCSWT